MIRARIGVPLTFVLLTASPHMLYADVRADEKSHVEFAGILGGMYKMFGGKAAKEGVISMVAVKGDRKATLNDSTGQIVDLNEEKIYDLDIHNKTYTVTTFAELRQRMEEAQRKAEESARNQPKPEAAEKPAAEQPSDKKPTEVDVDFDVKETGQRKSINGFDTHQVVMTITVREKGKTLEESGGLVLAADMWMTPRIDAMREVVDFDRRYAAKMSGPMVVGASPEQMASAMAAYPMMKDAIARMRTESVKLDGTPILTTTTLDAVKSAEQMAAEQKQSSEDSKTDLSNGASGLFNSFAKKMAKKKTESEPKSRATFMTVTNEVLKVTPDVAAADVSVPAGYRGKK